MPIINSRIQDEPENVEYNLGVSKGLNLLQDESLIGDGELTEAKNIELYVDGASPRRGTVNYGSSSGSKVVGGIGFYKSNGDRYFLRVAGGKLQKYVGTTPTDIGSATYTTDLNTNLIQIRDYIYTFNGTDAMTKFDGSTITTFTEITTPVGLTVTPTGSAGSTNYSYRVSAFNTTGETLACSAVAITNGNATLDTTNYNALAWTATSGATGYNVYGRKSTGLGETLLGTVYTNAYNDKGQDVPSTVIQPPEGNSTGGVKGKYVAFAMSRMFVAGVSGQPSRLFYGGVLNQIDNFSTSEGGFVDVFKNDGGEIKVIVPFQGGLIVGKDNGIYRFSFTSTGLPQLEEVTRSFGMISFRGTMAVENDVVFPAKKDGRVAFYTLGNQENYTGNVLRTNEISVKVGPKLTDVNLARLESACGAYFNNLYMCCLSTEGATTNDRVWVLDTRFGGWTYWEGIPANCFVSYTDSNGATELYYGSETSGYMVQMFTNDRNDNGVAISVALATKSYNQKLFDLCKIYRNPVLWFKDLSGGSISGNIYIDGVYLSGTFTLTPSNSGAGAGAMLAGSFLPGFSSGLSSVPNSDKPVEAQFTKQGRSIKFLISSNDINTKWKYLGNKIKSLTLPGKRLPPENRVIVS